jgi:hypothetical protein
MATIYETLRDYIEARLREITKLGTVYDYPVQEFVNAVYPVAVVYPSSDCVVEYETTSDDERWYFFSIDVFYQIKPEGINQAMIALFDLIDDVMAKFSENRGFDNPAISMPTNTVYLMTEPVKTQWGQIAGKDLIMAKIELKCRTSVQSS